ncbi:hypothetical protein IP88_16135 [alpha proteobacterium AAP81b]|nr:hypothetical protein IP88_16135 [alpha proteobacterium AAP81b]
MTHIAQHLHDAFPEHSALIATLKIDDAHFQGLAEDFDALDQAIVHAEAGDDPATYERIEAMKKERLALLDTVAAYLAGKV